MTGEMQTIRVGFIGGTRLPGNVRTFLRNVRDLLADHPIHFECDLLLRNDAENAPDGFRVVDSGLERTDSAMETIRSITAALIRYVDTTDTDLLFQVTKFPVHGVAAAVAGWRTNTPVLARYAGDNFREYKFDRRTATKAKSFVLNNILGRVPVKLADAIIVLGPHGHREIASRSDSATVYEIPQPVNTDRFTPAAGTGDSIRRELDISPNERMFLTVGRLTWRKGMDDIIHAAHELSASNEQFTWYVLGDGPMRSKLSDVPGIVTHGRVSHDEIPTYYRAADLVVHPSRIEGLPNVLLEATACGTASVARDVGECSSVATVTYDDRNELPELLRTRYGPPALNDRFSEDALRRAYTDAIVETAQTAVEK